MGQRRSASEVSRLVREYEASGESRREFCERRGIAVNTLDYWRRTRGRAPKLVEVEVQGRPMATGQFTLSLVNGRRIESEWRFADEDLARLIRVAEQA